MLPSKRSLFPTSQLELPAFSELLAYLGVGKIDQITMACTSWGRLTFSPRPQLMGTGAPFSKELEVMLSFPRGRASPVAEGMIPRLRTATETTSSMQPMTSDGR